MKAQHDRKNLTIKIITAAKVGDRWVSSVSTIGGRKSNNWTMTVRDVLKSKYEQADVDKVTKIEINTCHF